MDILIKNITNIAQLIVTILMLIAVIVLIIKMLKSKLNKDGKANNEIETADIQFCKDLLKESIKTIAIGISKQGGLTGKNAYNLTLKEIKQSQKIFEEIAKGEKENEKNSEKNVLQ